MWQKQDVNGNNWKRKPENASGGKEPLMVYAKLGGTIVPYGRRKIDPILIVCYDACSPLKAKTDKYLRRAGYIQMVGAVV